MKNAIIFLIISAFFSILFAAGWPTHIVIKNSYGCDSIAVLHDSVKIDADCDGDLDSTALCDSSQSIEIATAATISYSWLMNSAEDDDSAIWIEEVLLKDTVTNEWVAPDFWTGGGGGAYDDTITAGGADVGIFELRLAPGDRIRFVYRAAAASGASDTIFTEKRVLRIKD